MNWLLGLGWLGACVVAAVIVYQRSAGQVKFYTDLTNFCRYLGTEISFALTPLPKIVAGFQPRHAALRQVLTGYQQLLQSKENITRGKCAELTTDADVADFLCGLGRTGSITELDKIKTAVALFTAKKDQAMDNLQSKASIISKLLIIIGIAGVILWI